MAGIRISRTVSVPESEIELRFSRAGGPGGQHVNTSSTRVELRWDLEASQALTANQKSRVRRKLAGRLTKDGVLVLHAADERSQTRNREIALERFREVLGEALKVPRHRKPTKPSRSSVQRRLDEKRQQSEKKSRRKPPPVP